MQPVPQRTPMFDSSGNLTRTWFLFFSQSFGADSTGETVSNVAVATDGSYTPDLSQGNIQIIVLTADAIIRQPVNVPTSRFPWTLIIQQDATGGHSSTFDATYSCGYSLATAASPKNTECQQSMITQPSGNSGVSGAPSIDQDIAT